jgi:hypothetical protein
MSRPRAADDFATIRARMEDLRRERERADVGEADLPSGSATRRGDRLGPVVISVRRLRDAAG